MMDYNSRNIRSWSMLGSRRILGIALNEIAGQDDDFMFLTADVGRYYAINRFIELHRNQYVNVGIAEQNMVGVAAGLAKTGFHPMMATYATFMTSRVLDQMRVCMGLMKLPIVAVGVSAGLAEGDMSATHMGLEDIANVSAIPNVTILSPADSTASIKALFQAMEVKEPVYVRLTGSANNPCVYTEDFDYMIGKSNTVHEGKDIAIIATGTMVYRSIKAAEILEKKGLTCKVIDMHTIVPLDHEILDEISAYPLIVTVEEHNVVGGMGQLIAAYLSGKGGSARQIIMGVDRFYPDAGAYEDLLEECGLTAEKIAERAEKEMIRSETIA